MTGETGETGDMEVWREIRTGINFLEWLAPLNIFTNKFSCTHDYSEQCRIIENGYLYLFLLTIFILFVENINVSAPF